MPERARSLCWQSWPAPAWRALLLAALLGCTSIATAQSISFGTSYLYTVGSFPDSVAVGDFNGDGKPDLAVLNESSNTVSILLGNGNGTFAAAASLSTGSLPDQVIVGDFNRDGKIDLAVTNLNSSSVSVYLGNGNGTFAAPISFNVGTQTFGIATADFNADGKPDLAVVGYNNNSVVIYLGNGDGSFARGNTLAPGSSPKAVAVGDFNGDGKVDLVVTNTASNTVSVFIGNGDGSFQTGVTYAASFRPYAVTVADFNRDGKLDLAVANSNGNNISILLGRGDGSFAAPTNYAAGSTPAGIISGDFNGDGLLDLAVSNQFGNSLSVFPGRGDGTFQAPVTLSIGQSPLAIAVGDFNGDGKTDLVVTEIYNSSILVLLNSTTFPSTMPVFTSAALPAGTFNVPYTYTVTATGVPLPTFAVTGGALPTGLTLNGSSGVVSGTPSAGGTFVGTLTASNGVPPAATQGFSVIVARGGQTITFGALSNRVIGTGTVTVSATASSGLTVSFSSLTTPVCTVSGNSVTLVSLGTCTIQASQVGDANYAAAPNVSQSFVVTNALQSQTITFGVLSNKTLGAAPFAVTATASSGLAVTFASLTSAVCTVSGSTVTLVSAGTCTIQASQAGNANYNAATSVNQSLTVTLGSQTISFDTSYTYAVGSFPSSVAVGDFNGDGKSDLAVANQSSNTVSIFLGNGDGTFAAASSLSTGGLPYQVIVGDFNRDGKIDLAVTNLDSSSVSVYLGNGNGTFAAPITFNVGVRTYGLATADFNGDGKPDLAVVCYDTNTVVVFLGGGDGTFIRGATLAVGTSPQSVAVGDFNGDGKVDLVIANAGGNNVSILRGNGDGSFQAQVNYAAGYWPVAVTVADFNGDGKLDLAVANANGGNISILLGRGDGSFAAPTNYVAGSTPAGIVSGDFNGDGQLDLAVSNQFGSSLSVFPGKGDATFQVPIMIPIGQSPTAIAVGDFNRDGKTDIVTTEIYNSSVLVLLNTTTFPATIGAQSGSPQSTPVNMAYAAALVASVRNASSNPLPGIVVTFTAPATGASGTFAGAGMVARVVTDISGAATAPTFTANAISGSFSIIASAGPLSTNFALTNSAVTSQAPVFTSAALPAGTFNAPYTYTVTATGVPLPTFAVTSGALPTGLTLNGSSGVVSGTPSAGGTFVGTLTASNGVPPSATQAFSIVVARIGQTITFGTLSNRVMGTGPVTVSASASSGLPVSFSSLTTPVCTVSGNAVTLVSIGTCTIQASQAGNGNYSAATSVNQSFSVSQGSQTITFGTLSSKTLGTPPFTVSATASSGLPVSFSSLTTAVCTLSGNTVTVIALGTCTVRASQAGNASYTAAPNVDQSFVVRTAQTITFGSLADRVFNSGPFTVSATASSGLVVGFSSLTPSVCTVSASTVTLVAIGTCTVRAAQAGDATYGAAPNVDRSFNAANQTITFFPLSEKSLGSPPFTVSATASSGLPVTFSSLTAPVCTVSGSTVTLVASGTCTIRAAQGGNGSYPPAVNVDQSFAIVATVQGLIQYLYDAAGRLIFVFAPSGDAAQYVYDPAGNITRINRFVAGNLAIAQFTPASGLIGSPVTIIGTGFNPTPTLNTVKFNGTVATVTSGTPNQLMVTVPVGATTGTISVTNGANTATSTAIFTIGGAPTITGFSPTIGVAGTSVAVTGTNFDSVASRDSVAFNLVTAATSTASATTLTAPVPAGATSGRIKVTTPSGTVSSTSDFFVPPSPYTASSVAATGRLVVDGGITQAVVPANKVALIVFDAVAGQNLGFGLSGVANRAGTITILKPDGSILVPATSFPTGTPAGLAGGGQVEPGLTVDLPAMPVTGTYTIVVAVASYPGITIIVDLKLSSDVTGSFAGPGAKITFKTDRYGQHGRYTFSGTAGQVLGVNFTNNTFNTIAAFFTNTVPSTVLAKLLKPDGSVLASTYASTFYSVTALSGAIAPLALPVTGIYTLYLTPVSDFIGQIDAQIGAPDLTVTNLAVGLVGVPRSGSFTIPVSFQINNIGTLSVSSTTYAYVSTDSVLDATDDAYVMSGIGVNGCVPGALAPCAFNASITTVASASGTYTLFIKANGGQNAGKYSPAMYILESNPNNNGQAIGVVLPTGPADLTVSNLSVGTISANASGGYGIATTFQVNNIGLSVARAPWYDYAYLSIDALLQDTDPILGLANYHGVDLAPGASYAVSKTFNTSQSTAPGNYTLFVKADGGSAASGQYSPTGANVVYEADENNNVQSASITLPTRPDLTVSNVSVGTITRNGDNSYNIPVTFQVNNVGASGAQAPWYDYAFLSTDSVLQDTDQRFNLGVLRNTDLAAGASYTVTNTFYSSTSTTPGTYTLFVKADGYGLVGGTGQVLEANDANNTQSVTVVLQ